MYAIAFGPRQSLRSKADTYKRKVPPPILADGGALRE